MFLYYVVLNVFKDFLIGYFVFNLQNQVFCEKYMWKN